MAHILWLHFCTNHYALMSSVKTIYSILCVEGSAENDEHRTKSFNKKVSFSKDCVVFHIHITLKTHCSATCEAHITKSQLCILTQPTKTRHLMAGAIHQHVFSPRSFHWCFQCTALNAWIFCLLLLQKCLFCKKCDFKFQTTKQNICLHFCRLVTSVSGNCMSDKKKCVCK